jgi:Xaa-Pro aminopeptidase
MQKVQQEEEKMKLSRDFHLRKMQQVRERLEEEGLDAIVLLNLLNIYYTTGFWHSIGSLERPVIVVIPQVGDPILMVSLDFYGHQVQLPISDTVEEIRIYSEYPYTSEGWPTLKWTCQQLHDAGLQGKRIGVEDNYTPINDGVCDPWFEQFVDYFDGKVVRAGGLVSEMRMIHDPEEIELLRKACYYADLMVKTISEQVREGLTERGVAETSRRIVEEQMRQDLPDIVPGMLGRRLVGGAPNHQHLRERRIVQGEPMIINCGAVVGGYHGESERCGIIGSPTAKQQELFEVGMECQLRARDAVRPGVTGHEVDRVAKEIVERAGHKYLYGVGHGLGLLGHEPPWIREHSETVLEPGMVITVEPGLGTLEWGSFHCSDTVLVTENGYESLTVYDGIHRLDLP